MLRYALVFLILLTLPLRANLGETVDQCVKRYGKPLGFSEANARTPFGTLVFVAGGYTLMVFLLNNVEVGARVGKADKSAFSDAELKTIMDADASSAWKTEPSSDPASLTWSRSDKATALYDKEKHMLIFTSSSMAEALRRQEAKPPPPAGPAPAAAPVSTSGRVFAPASSSAFPPSSPQPSPPATGK